MNTPCALLLSSLAAISLSCQEAGSSIDYSSSLKGGFTLQGAQCAGFEFTGNGNVVWRNEIDCSGPDTLAIHWLDRRTFVAKDIHRVTEDCPPRNWIYRVKKFNGTDLVLEEVDTGWGKFETDTLAFTGWSAK